MTFRPLLREQVIGECCPSRRPSRPDGAGPGPGTAGHVPSIRRDGRARGRAERRLVARGPLRGSAVLGLQANGRQLDSRGRRSGPHRRRSVAGASRWRWTGRMTPSRPTASRTRRRSGPAGRAGSGPVSARSPWHSPMCEAVLDGGVPVLLGLTVFDTFYRPDAAGHIADPPSGGERPGPPRGCRGRSPDRRASHPKFVGHHVGARWLCVDRRRLRRLPMPETLGSSTPLPTSAGTAASCPHGRPEEGETYGTR